MWSDKQPLAHMNNVSHLMVQAVQSVTPSTVAKKEKQLKQAKAEAASRSKAEAAAKKKATVVTARPAACKGTNIDPPPKDVDVEPPLASAPAPASSETANEMRQQLVLLKRQEAEDIELLQ
eukprot:2064274-Pleurochrysis_carterae.AAC.2